MPDPMAHDEGGWGDLARELGVEPTRPTPPEEPPPLPETADVVAEDEGFADGLTADEPDGDEPDGEGEEGAEGEGEQPGTGRKRRRRRRRRKKGGPEAAEAATVAATVGEEEAGVVSAVPTEADDAPEAEADSGDEAEADEEFQEGRPGMVEEDTGNEVLRELISSWNVPAWDDIIGGLYRPDR